MLGFVISTSKKKDETAPSALAIPPALRRRLAKWIDIEAVEADGSRLWLGSVLPLLPDPGGPGSSPNSTDAPRPERPRELARDLVDCASERARLTVVADRYYRDNEALARWLKALEAALRTFDRAGHGAEIPSSEEASEMSERYLPRR